MADHTNHMVPRIFKMVVLISWLMAFWLLLTNIGDSPLIAKFLNPRYWVLVKVGVSIILIYLLVTYYDIPHDMGMGAFAGLVQVAILILPILYLPMAATSHLSPTAFEKRSIAKSRPLVEGEMFSGRPQVTVDGNDEGGSVDLLSLSINPRAFIGKMIKTKGTVYRDKSIGDNRFLLYRLIMWCCAADARPVGVLVKPMKPNDLEQGQWVEVEGVVERVLIYDKPAIVISEARVRTIQAPRSPYLFQ